MGLDSVELIIEVEEKFQIQIPDIEAENINTVGDLHQCILTKVERNELNRCSTQKIFYQLRRELSENHDIPFEKIKPDLIVAVSHYQFRSCMTL